MAFGSYWNQNLYGNNANISLPMTFMQGQRSLMNGFGGSVFASQYFQSPGYGGTSSSSTQYKTSAEKNIQRENSKIISLLETLAKSSYISSDEKSSLNEDIRNAKNIKDLRDKNEELKFVYDSYSGVIQEFILSHKTKDIKIDGVALDQKLDSIGYERSDSYIDGKISEMHSIVDSLGKNNGSLSNSDIAVDVMNLTSKFGVLDILSSYNSAYSGENLIEQLKDKYTNAFSNKKDDAGMKDDTKKFAENLAAKLSDEAVKIAMDIKDNQIKNTLMERARKLRSVKIDDEDFVAKFNGLYVITRVLSARNLGNMLSADYGRANSDYFNEDMFLEATKKDLENEGLKISIDKAMGMFTGVTLRSKISFENVSVRKERNIDNMDAETQVKVLASNGVLKESDDYISVYNEDYDEDEYYTVYEEAIPTSEDGNKKLYVVKDYQIYELLTDEDGVQYLSEEPIEASEIQDKVVEKNTEELKAHREEERKEEETRSNDFEKVANVLGRQNTEITGETRTIEDLNLPVFKDVTTDKQYVIYKNSVYEINEDGITGEVLTSGSIIQQASKEGYEAGKKLGQEIKNTIKGRTEDKNYDKVNENLAKVNKTNVVGLIEASGGKILTDVDSEHDKNNPIAFENKKRVAKALLQRAKDLGLNDTEEYKKIENILSKSEYKDSSDKNKSFNKLNASDANWTWGVGSVITVLSLPLTIKKVFAPIYQLMKRPALPSTMMRYSSTFIGKLAGFLQPLVTQKGLLAIFIALSSLWSLHKFRESIIKQDHDILDDNMSKLCQRIKDNEHGIVSYENTRTA